MMVQRVVALLESGEISSHDIRRIQKNIFDIKKYNNFDFLDSHTEKLLLRPLLFMRDDFKVIRNSIEELNKKIVDLQQGSNIPDDNSVVNRIDMGMVASDIIDHLSSFDNIDSILEMAKTRKSVEQRVARSILSYISHAVRNKKAGMISLIQVLKLEAPNCEKYLEGLSVLLSQIEDSISAYHDVMDNIEKSYNGENIDFSQYVINQTKFFELTHEKNSN